MCRPAATRTLQPVVTNTNSVWIGPQRNAFTSTIATRDGFDGRELVRISDRRLLHSNHFAARSDDSEDTSTNSGAPESNFVTWTLEGVSECDTPISSPRREQSTRGWLRKWFENLGMHLLLEPGRSIIAPSGVLLTKVVYTKTNRGKTFVVVDSAMNDLMRPALYGAIHPITKVTRKRSDKGSEKQRVDIVGPICETGDCFLHDWPLGEVKPGDVLAIWGAGAYGMAQASNYNARCRPPEVLVAGKSYRLIRRRETPDDLVRKDVLA